MSNTAVGAEFVINQQVTENNYTHPFSSDGVATDAAGNFVATWMKLSPGAQEDIYARRFRADGTPLGNEFLVNTTTAGIQFYPSVAVAPTGAFVITWLENKDGDYGSGIFAQRYDSSGAPQGGEFRVDVPPANPQYKQQLSRAAMDSQGNFVVTWDSFGTPQLALQYREIYMRRFDSNGVALSGNILVNTEVAWEQYDPNIDMAPDGRFVITWSTGSTYNEVGDHDGIAVFAQRFDANGAPLGVNFQVNSTTAGNQQWADVAMDASGGFTVVFMSNPYTGNDELNRILGQRYDSSGAKLGGEFIVADFAGYRNGIPQIPYYPVVDMSATGDFVAYWMVFNQPGGESGVIGQQYFSDGSKDGPQVAINDVLPSPWRQSSPIVAMSPFGDYLVAWTTDVNRIYQVHAQRFVKGIRNAQTQFHALSATQSTARPALSWNAIPGAISYDLWIDNKTTGTSQFIRRKDLSTNTFVNDVDMPLGKYWAWVRGVGADGIPSKWSAVAVFQVSPPVILKTVTKQQNTSRPFVEWVGLSGAASYDLWLNNLSTGQSQIVRNTNIAGTNWTSDADLSLGKYRVWVRGKDAAGIPATWSNAGDFDVVPAPVQLSPSVGTFDRQPTLTWAPVMGASSYDVYVKNRNTGVTVYYPTRITATSWQAPAALTDGPYRWWVQARSPQNVVGLWSLPVDVYVGGRTEIISPISNTQSSNPEFRWGAVQGAVRYELWVNSDNPQQRIIYLTTLTGTSYTPTTALAAGTYRFWVRAVSSNGTFAPWSITAAFSIV